MKESVVAFILRCKLKEGPIAMVLRQTEEETEEEEEKEEETEERRKKRKKRKRKRLNCFNRI